MNVIEYLNEVFEKVLGEIFCSKAIDKLNCMWMWYQIAPVFIPVLVYLFVLACIIAIGYLVWKVTNKVVVKWMMRS
jgi:hypothetical protein